MKELFPKKNWWKAMEPNNEEKGRFPKLLTNVLLHYLESKEHFQERILLSLLPLLEIIIMLVLNLLTN